MVHVKVITTVTITDPDTNLPVEVTIVKEEGGGMFGIDSSYLANTEEPILSPFGNGVINDSNL